MKKSDKPASRYVHHVNDGSLTEIENRLNSTTETLQRISSIIPDHIIIQDIDLRYTLVINPQLGLSEADMIGRKDHDFLEKKDADALTAIKRRVIKSGKRFRMVIPVNNLKGEREYFEGFYLPKFDVTGRIDGVMGYFRNITNQKNTEEKLRKFEEVLRNSKELLERLNQRQNEIRENERALISKEVHDELGQSLSALKLDLNQMRIYMNDNSEAVSKLERMIGLVSTTIKNVQRISSDLRPGILDDLGLVSAIEWYCEEFENRSGIKCNLELDNLDYPHSGINLTFFRLLQEVLANVIRHARASNVNIELHGSQKGTKLVIHDNGIGISVQKIRSQSSMGLINIRERLKQFNGKISISSKKGEGTKLTIFIPDIK
jgi:two-component system, NarL family, sensor histidine kinase UhpB